VKCHDYKVYRQIYELFHVCLVGCDWCDVESGIYEAICLRGDCGDVILLHLKTTYSFLRMICFSSFAPCWDFLVSMQNVLGEGRYKIMEKYGEC
jgi:hypothetical protein